MADPRRTQAISPAALLSALSEPRLEAYRLHADEPLEAAIGRYMWNIALCRSFYPALHLLEVTLRNNLHRVVTAHYGTTEWYDLTPSVLTLHEQEAITKAKAELGKQEKDEEPDRVVAELSFGFWTSLLGRNYEQKLWPKLLSFTFPHMPRRERTRANVADRFHQMRILRNRISHHEPIYKQKNLTELHDAAHQALGWLSPASLGLLHLVEDFPEVYARGSVPYEPQLT